MTSLSLAVKRVVRDLTELKIGFALVGALAIGARGRIRQTLDADIAISLPNKAEAQKLVENLLVRGYGINNLYESKSSIALARLFAPDDQDKLIELDFLFDLCGIEKEVVETSELLEIWPGLIAPVASIPALLAMKARCQELPKRIQDKADLVNQLIPFSTENDLVKARELVSLIEERKYNEGRNLLLGFNQLVELVKKKEHFK